MYFTINAVLTQQFRVNPLTLVEAAYPLQGLIGRSLILVGSGLVTVFETCLRFQVFFWKTQTLVIGLVNA